MNARRTFINYFGKLCDGHRLAFKVDCPVAAFVILLSFPIRPAAIGFRIAFGIVDSIKAHTLWPFTHIAKERRKIVPLIGDCNFASAIKFVERTLGIVATLKKVDPDSVNRLTASAMSGNAFAPYFVSQTAAAPGVTTY